MRTPRTLLPQGGLTFYDKSGNAVAAFLLTRCHSGMAEPTPNEKLFEKFFLFL